MKEVKLSYEFEEMRINNCQLRPPAQGCPYCGKEEMRKVVLLFKNITEDRNIPYFGSEHIENLQKANELYCKDCDKYKPRPTKKRDEFSGDYNEA